MSRRRRLAVVVGLLAAAAFAGPPPARAETPRFIARAAATEPAGFSVYFPLQHQHALDELIAAQSDPGAGQYHRFLTPAQFREQFGPPPATVAAVVAQLRGAGFTVLSRSALGLRVAGSVAGVEAAFSARLAHAKFADGTHALVAEHGLALTGALAASGAMIPQFTTTAPKQRHSHVLGPSPDNFQTAVGPYYSADLRQAYDYPSVAALNGKGVVIGVLMNGGFNPPDMTDYFVDQLVPASLRPKITTVPVAGGAPFDPQNSAETHLDIQQSSGMALGASVVLYNLSDLGDATIIDGLTQIDEDNTADVVNMSFGGPESDYLAANNNGVDTTWLIKTIEHALFLQGNAQGITFVASSGDHGAIPVARSCTGTICAEKPVLSVESPADDPNVTAVGGTNLVTTHASGSTASAYVTENAVLDALVGTNAGVWGSGGGISTVFAKPAYQGLVTTPSAKFRTVPDLALHMGGCQPGFTGFGKCTGNRSSDYVWIGAERITVIGTSASAPDIAGLLALKVKLVGHRLGNENLDIYTRAKAQAGGSGKPFHHAGIIGGNGHFAVKAPYDAVIGNGTVDARQFLGATAMPPSGAPNTPSNP